MEVQSQGVIRATRLPILLEIPFLCFVFVFFSKAGYALLVAAWVQLWPLAYGDFSLWLSVLYKGRSLVSTLTQRYRIGTDRICEDSVSKSNLSEVSRGGCIFPRNTMPLTAGPKVRKFAVSVVTRQSKSSITCEPKSIRKPEHRARPAWPCLLRVVCLK